MKDSDYDKTLHNRTSFRYIIKNSALDTNIVFKGLSYGGGTIATIAVLYNLIRCIIAIDDRETYHKVLIFRFTFNTSTVPFPIRWISYALGADTDLEIGHSMC